jgi:hypothetical protein
MLREQLTLSNAFATVAKMSQGVKQLDLKEDEGGLNRSGKIDRFRQRFLSRAVLRNRLVGFLYVN